MWMGWSGLGPQLCPEAWFSEDSTGSWEGPSILQVWTFLNKRTWIFSLPACVVVLPGCHGVDITSYLHLIGLGTGSQYRLSIQPAGSRDGGDQCKLGSPVMSPCVHNVGLTSRQLFILTKYPTPSKFKMSSVDAAWIPREMTHPGGLSQDKRESKL